MTSLLGEQLFVLFAILAAGSLIGRVTIKGISLGTAGVLFVALLFGHFRFTVPREITELGLVLFVYAVGLQAGPRFFRTFRKEGAKYVLIAFVVVAAGALATAGSALLLNIPYDIASGLYTGALTCTPALAAAIDAAEKISSGNATDVSVGYGVAYPCSMIGVVLLMQFLPRILRRELSDEERLWRESQRADLPTLETRQFIVSNPNCDGKTIREINPHRMSLVNISRIHSSSHVSVAKPDSVLRNGDIVMAVGPADELDKLHILLGEETHVAMDINPDLTSVDVEVTKESVAGKRLRDLHAWQKGIVITRLRRQEMEIAPTGATVIEIGDVIRLVGEKAGVSEISEIVGAEDKKLEETNMVPFLAGLLAGVCVGVIPIHLPNEVVVKLGIAGGTFLVSLLIGHFGRIGPFTMRVPNAAKNLSRELGLMLFLAGAGTSAGSRIAGVLGNEGFTLLLTGAAVTFLSVVAGLVVTHVVFRMNILAVMGALCACMTNPPALGAANAQTDTDLPTLAYASVYPVSLIFKILLAQLLVEILP